MAAIGEVRSELEKEINRAFARMKRAHIEFFNATVEEKRAPDQVAKDAAHQRVEKAAFDVTIADIEINRLRHIIEARKAIGDCERSTYHE